VTEAAATDIPFPALTPAQRLHLEVNGYVLIENVLDADEVGQLLETTYGIEKRFRDTGELPGPNCHLSATREDFFRVDNLPHLAPCYFDYLTKPRLLGMVQEIVGGTVRLEQSDAHIRRPVSSDDQRLGFHRGISPAFPHTSHGLYHFSFVKTLTNLTDLGLGDGGTTVIAGTHKVSEEVERDVIVDAAMADLRLIHTVEAPAGSTLLFYESLMHSSGIINSDRDRVLIIGGYTPTMFQPWNGYEPDPEFAKGLSDEHRALITGDAKFGWQRQTRRLGDAARP
jgi:ectoine hydroxylase-related dioxygenase (phytanoyl-CoA dioxygenase family)